MSSIDWEWWAFREGADSRNEKALAHAHDAGFQRITSLACTQCDTARYNTWIFTGGGFGSPTQAEKMLAATKDLGQALINQCPDHPTFIKKT